MIISVDEEGMMALAAVCDMALRTGGMKSLGHVNRVLSNTKVEPRVTKLEETPPEPTS